jgi:hypothetical protein
VLSSLFFLEYRAVVASRSLLDFGYRSVRIPVERLTSANFFVESESDCTSERARRQFSIFGALEEIGGDEIWSKGKIVLVVKVRRRAAL